MMVYWETGTLVPPGGSVPRLDSLRQGRRGRPDSTQSVVSTRILVYSSILCSAWVANWERTARQRDQYLMSDMRLIFIRSQSGKRIEQGAFEILLWAQFVETTACKPSELWTFDTAITANRDVVICCGSPQYVILKTYKVCRVPLPSPMHERHTNQRQILRNTVICSRFLEMISLPS